MEDKRHLTYGQKKLPDALDISDRCEKGGSLERKEGGGKNNLEFPGLPHLEKE